jgi:uncharacterized integral membrane protein (TIGR00698 family)
MKEATAQSSVIHSFLNSRYLGPGLAAVLLPLLVFTGNPALALICAGCLTLALNRPLLDVPSSYGKLCLQTAIVLLGFRMNLETLWSLSASYTWIVAAYVIITLAGGLVLGMWLKSDRTTAQLMASGTAICGGTAIATVAPLLDARPNQIAVALAVVFGLNAIALFTFPAIGAWLEMSQLQFGLWSALAIHDTSSVVATAAIYGDQAAEVATTVKLGRTLWLIPLVFAISLFGHRKEATMRVPGFVLLFVLAAGIGSVIDLPSIVTTSTGTLSKALLVCALFLVGNELTRETLRNIRGRVLIHALLLWAIVVPTTAYLVLQTA